jgi:hypothetical protein
VNIHNARKLDIEARRRQVASLLARSKTQTEIAQLLGVDQTTISGDVKALTLMSQRFVYDLAKSDLASYYKRCLDGIEEANREAWNIYSTYSRSDNVGNGKIRLMALRVAIQAQEVKFKLLTDGPSILAVNTLEDRIDSIEQSYH